jgi:hypothetical protein
VSAQIVMPLLTIKLMDYSRRVVNHASGCAH